MDFGTKQKVIGAATRIIQGQQAKRQSGNATVDIDVGAYNMALLTNNILLAGAGVRGRGLHLDQYRDARST